MSATNIPIKRALISVYDKTGLPQLAQELIAAGVEIVSTGSTAQTIAQASLPVTEVATVTGFPECLNGRVKTLHPHIHAGILADRRQENHRQQLQDLHIEPFDLVVCNLYPFAQTIASGADFQTCIEQIDIGGPTLVRAAAKNHANVTIVVDPGDYPELITSITQGGFNEDERRGLAAKAFAHTAQYDAQIAQWFAKQLGQDQTETKPAAGPHMSDLPDAVTELPQLLPELRPLSPLRYGENPHQQAAAYQYGTQAGGVAGAKQLGGKPMSYNNYQDADAAWRAAWDHRDPCVAVIKHANPCGVAIGETIAQAHQAAHACDPLSAYGGVIAANRTVSLELARQVKPVFTEVILAPGYEPEALALLQQKKNLRILEVTQPETDRVEIKQISGGMLCQERDLVDQAQDHFENWTLVAGPQADPQTARDLEFAWRAVRAVKSNAILLAKQGATVGIGMGQVNRVDSCALAIERANTLGVPAPVASDRDGSDPQPVPPQRSAGAVASSDAFFPFADGVEALIAAGVKAIVQPGGSIRDQEVIAACEKAGVTMYLTGIRHFWH